MAMLTFNLLAHDGDEIPRDPRAFLALIQERIAEIPDDCMADAWVKLEPYDEYEPTSHWVLRIGYRRHETPEEEATRYANEAAHRARVEHTQAARERADYERLKAKFEGAGR